MLADQFGMAGLLTFLRAIELDPQIVGLALGHDLTNLGLNLNAPEFVFPSIFVYLLHINFTTLILFE